LKGIFAPVKTKQRLKITIPEDALSDLMEGACVVIELPPGMCFDRIEIQIDPEMFPTVH
jgi:hypothetical protein